MNYKTGLFITITISVLAVLLVVSVNAPTSVVKVEPFIEVSDVDVSYTDHDEPLFTSSTPCTITNNYKTIDTLGAIFDDKGRNVNWSIAKTGTGVYSVSPENGHLRFDLGSAASNLISTLALSQTESLEGADFTVTSSFVLPEKKQVILQV